MASILPLLLHALLLLASSALSRSFKLGVGVGTGARGAVVFVMPVLVLVEWMLLEVSVVCAAWHIEASKEKGCNTGNKLFLLE